MAFSQVEIVANQIEKQRLGYQAISLTHYDDTLEPQIAAGSKVEIGNALFEANAAESISGWSLISNNSDVYIKLTVSGTSVTASFTTVAPTWNTAKQGWYSGSERYIGGLRKDSSGNYTDKWLYVGGPQIRHGAIDANAVRTNEIQDLAVTAAKLIKSLGSPNSHSLVVGTPWVPPAGLYLFSYTDPPYVFEINALGTWRSLGQGGGFLWCDGTNARLTGSSGTVTVYYLQVQ